MTFASAYDDGQARFYLGDSLTVLRELPSESVHCVVTSPPYWGLRDYGCAEQMGLESTPAEYLEGMTVLFEEVRRVLRSDGTAWVNMGDGYCASRSGPIGEFSTLDGGREGAAAYREAVAAARYSERSHTRERFPDMGLKPKDLIGMPWRLALALQAAGWWLRRDIIWHKPNPMPESAYDRPTTSHEYIFLLTKCAKYYYDAFAIREPASGAHARGDGVNPKAIAEGQREEAARAFNARRAAEPNSEQNPSFSGSTAALVTHRNKRSVWTVATEPYPEAHFATFPESLIEPCILAGTSEHGCCAECGAPWARVVEVVDHAGVLGESYHDHTNDLGKGQRGVPAGSSAPERRTVGWQPSCSHEAPAAPCVVLDPFLGSGTTAAVSKRLGRRSVGIELNADYLELAKKRVSQMGLFAGATS